MNIKNQHINILTSTSIEMLGFDVFGIFGTSSSSSITTSTSTTGTPLVGSDI